MDDNPLHCDCDLIWISDWMKRLISDMRVVNIEAALQAHTMASMSQCIVHFPIPISDFDNTSHHEIQNMRKISLLDLRSEDILCENISFKVTSNGFLIILLIVSINRLCSRLENLHFITISTLYSY